MSSMIEKLASLDPLFEDQERRGNGRFYTPKHLVHMAHHYLDRYVGKNWTKEYTVWDNSCGTGNLTKGLSFTTLYQSTLEQAELDLIPASQGATPFLFDFLNDPIWETDAWPSTRSIPRALQKALVTDAPFIFFMNPPFAKGAFYGTGALKSTRVNAQMLGEKLGQASANLYAQFLYRIACIKEHYGLTRCYVAFFSPTLLFTGSSFSKFRKRFFSSFRFMGASMFSAEQFSDTAKHWAVSFSIWEGGETKTHQTFPCDVWDWNNEGERIYLGSKALYNTDPTTGANRWIREPVRGIPTYDAPNMTSALRVKQSGIRRGKWADKGLGYFYSNSNNVEKNPINVALFSSPFSAAEGVVIREENFERCIALFAARKLIKNSWINNKDEYLVPDVRSAEWPLFYRDALIFSLFHTSSQQSSLRQILYKEKTYNIINAFFFMDRLEMFALAKSYGFHAMMEDGKNDSERYMQRVLQDVPLSSEGEAVLLCARDIVRRTMVYRKQAHEAHPDWHLQAWDAGWYQIKRIAEHYAPELLETFSVKFDNLQRVMVPRVYSLGFLKE